jgi:hypothetical protein
VWASTNSSCVVQQARCYRHEMCGSWLRKMPACIVASVRRLALCLGLYLSNELIPLLVLSCLQFADENFTLQHTGPGKLCGSIKVASAACSFT